MSLQIENVVVDPGSPPREGAEGSRARPRGENLMEVIPCGREARWTLSGDDGTEKHRPLRGDPLIVSLNFDDGSFDQYAVRSILAEHSMRATFFVNSGAVGVRAT